MTDAHEEVMDETRQRLARLEGELIGVRDQLASSLATEAQLRQELEACRAEAAVAAAELAHAQRQGADREKVARRRLADLEERLTEARRLREQAEHERAAVITALGRRARNALRRTSESESDPAPGEKDAGK